MWICCLKYNLHEQIDIRSVCQWVDNTVGTGGTYNHSILILNCIKSTLKAVSKIGGSTGICRSVESLQDASQWKHYKMWISWSTAPSSTTEVLQDVDQQKHCKVWLSRSTVQCRSGEALQGAYLEKHCKMQIGGKQCKMRINKSTSSVHGSAEV